ncbi:MAG TPA: CocE/NonD family hydrolase [Terriglobales bacterium]|nr:CocE/NonD family hydrolase [Terriglobales bacterium]
MKKLRVVILLMIAVASVAVAEDKSGSVDLIWGVKVPMRDGIHLNATVYRPHEQKDPLPVIFELTPYISDTYHARAYYFAKHGYVFALVDVRGRGNSEGKFDPFFQEAQDGYDTVEWLAKQPWSNGKVTMWGGSYAGFDQWLTLRGAPPHLATIVPAAAAHVGIDFPMFHNIATSYIIQWLTYTSGNTGNINLFGEDSFWREKFGEMYYQHRPFHDLDQIVGNTTTKFQEWVQHPLVDAYMKRADISPEQYRKINVPILTITGSYDGDQPGALTYYQDHMKYGSEDAKARHYLIIGPWDHAGTRTPKKEVGGLTFGDASLLDLNKLHTEWYDWTLKNGAKPEFLKKRVAYYVMGADEWKYADSLDAVASEKRTLYLDSQDGSANDVFHSGALTTNKPGSSKPDHYVYDPLDVRPGDLEKEDIPNSLTDQRTALNLYGEGVVYQSEPFAEDTEISGWVKLSMWISMDVPDTDFSPSLYEIMPDGSSVQLTSDVMRARYRDSLSEAKLVTPGKIERYEFSGFTWFSRKIAKGSRLRLVFQAINSRQTEKNYNSGGVVADETAKDARTAHVTVYHDSEHPSALEIPVVR